MAKSKTLLIVGGAGYIGSYINAFLQDKGYHTVVLDDLSTGDKKRVIKGNFFCGDMGNPLDVEPLFQKFDIHAVLLLAASISVPESVKSPAKYYINNVANSLNLLQIMLTNNVKHLIFSSSAAIFGNPLEQYISERHPENPINPYGQSKWMLEKILRDYDQAYGLKSISLRYFNAAGGDPEGKIQIGRLKSTNLIPTVLDRAYHREVVSIFGTDYETPDGTCIRDYIHIADLASAHELALEYLERNNESDCFNLGNGNGYSVREVFAAIEKVTHLTLNVEEAPRRRGDPSCLVADTTKAKAILGWKPKLASIETIVADTWKVLHGKA